MITRETDTIFVLSYYSPAKSREEKVIFRDYGNAVQVANEKVEDGRKNVEITRVDTTRTEIKLEEREWRES